MLKYINLILLFILISSIKLYATTWYLDNTATGANNGTSWANAWESVSSAAGSSVVAGDTVYISGGTNGSSQTYSSFTPKNGTSSGIITYKIGQDSSYNGTAIFLGNGSGYWLSDVDYLTISGDAGDGLRHFMTTNYVSPCWQSSGSGTSFEIGYVNFGTFDGEFQAEQYGLSNVKIHNCYAYNTATSGGGYVFYLHAAGSSWNNGFMVYSNVIYAPYNTITNGFGWDCLQISGEGYTISGNFIAGYPGGTQLGEHQDGIQDWAGGSSYIRIYNNIFYNLANSCINISQDFEGDSHVREYNNIGIFNSSYAAQDNEAMFIGFAASGLTATDCLIANNIMCNGGDNISIGTPGDTDTYSSCYGFNNISVQGPGYYWASGVVNADNVTISTTAGAQTNFVNYVSNLNGTNNNFNLITNSTTLIGKGTNLSSYAGTDPDLTNDFNGNPRPISGNWDIGPYQYGTNAPTFPTNTVSPLTNNYGTLLSGTYATNEYYYTNTGTGTLNGTVVVSYPFLLIGGSTYSLAAGASQILTNEFAPTNSGTFTNIISFSDNANSPTVVAIGISTNVPTPIIQITPTTTTFTTVLTNLFVTNSVQVTNIGGGTLTGTASVSSPFSIISGGTYNLTTNQGDTVQIQFTSSSAGTFTNTVTFTQGTMVVIGTATNAPAPITQVTPASINFGTTLTNSPITNTFNITNIGGSTLFETNSTTSPFSIISSTTYSLTGGQGQIIQVVFTPLTNGNYTNNLISTDNGGNYTNIMRGSATNSPTSVPNIPFIKTFF